MDKPQRTCLNCAHNSPDDFKKYCQYCIGNMQKHWAPAEQKKEDTK